MAYDDGSIFEPVRGRTNLLRCRVCGGTGPPTNGIGWQTRHLRGHASCSNGCGRSWPLTKDGKARRCTGRAAENCYDPIGTGAY